MDSAVDNIALYYNSNPEYQDIPLEEFKLICTSPFKFVKEVLNRGILKDIRLQYFGVFEVSASRIKYSKKQLQENFDNKVISEKRYQDRMKILNSYEEG